MLTKRIAFWLLLILFAASAAWWVVCFPYDPAELYRAVPPTAALVSEHDRVAQRWQVLAYNPLVKGVFATLGTEQSDIDEAVSDPVVADWVNRFAGRKTVVGYVPALGLHAEQAWVLASWAGGYGQLLRWGFFSGLMKGFDRIELDGRRAWVLRSEESDVRERLSVAVMEGVLLGCYSADPRGVFYLMHRLETGAPVSSEFEGWLRDENAGGAPQDRGWARWPWGRVGSFQPERMEYALSDFDQYGSAGWVKGRLPLPNAPRLDRAPAIARLAGMVGDAADAFVALPVDYVQQWLTGKRLSGGAEAVAEILEVGADPGGFAFAALASASHSGRVLGIKVPTLLVGVETEDEEAALKNVAALLDLLNGRYGWGLIPRRTEAAGLPMVVLDSSRGGIYGSLREDERPAFTAQNGWLILASNMRVLADLCGRDAASGAETPEAGGGGGARTWREELDDANAMGWVDVRKTGNALKDVIAVWSLVLIVNGGAEAAQTREQLELAKAWIEAVQPLGTCGVWVDSRDGDARVRFRLGENARGR